MNLKNFLLRFKDALSFIYIIDNLFNLSLHFQQLGIVRMLYFRISHEFLQSIHQQKSHMSKMYLKQKWIFTNSLNRFYQKTVQVQLSASWICSSFLNVKNVKHVKINMLYTLRKSLKAGLVACNSVTFCRALPWFAQYTTRHMSIINTQPVIYLCTFWNNQPKNDNRSVSIQIIDNVQISF